ncbi:uncharacterized protein LOC109429098 isoform X2 [Aedes albopictus]|uniref:Phospholipase A2-like central domain-containing protein n=1 Tax=Aedes albopictus TaxID=7160 RepID=A0ABM2A0C4_AEDAL|nr:uncharacterized protein LOC109429098 isoform X2 [Aedes albopictus]
MYLIGGTKVMFLGVLIGFLHIAVAKRVDRSSKRTRSHLSVDSYDRELAVLRMKDRIRKVLNVQNENETVSEHVLSVFNVENINPTYVFLLPNGEKNGIRKLIYQKSDFLEAEYPNVTSLNKFKRSLNSSYSVISEVDYPDVNLKSFAKSVDNEDAEDTMLEIVADNIRTERNFIKFMDDLNEDLENELKRQSLKFTLKSQSSLSVKKSNLFTPYTYVNTQTVGWDDLGLEGWSGGLREVHGHRYEHPVIERPKPEEIHHEPAVSIDASFNPLKFLKAPAHTNAVQPNVLVNSSMNTAIPTKSKNPGLILSPELEQKLEEIYNRTKTIPGKPPRWPITNSRDAHRDEDVFIARANNPFGHSTKWRWSNESEEVEKDIEEANQQTREGRSKRAVFNLYSMIKCATGCDPLIYKGYGCYCGFLGSGHVVDGIDRCCKIHDNCYTTSKCPMFLEYFVPYLWKCYRGRPLCALHHGEWDGWKYCATRLCLCDRSLSMCFSKHSCPGKKSVC